jgi:hypothetical protein
VIIVVLWVSLQAEDIAEYEDSAGSPRSWVGDPPRDLEE